MFKKILIANRGEIACRVIATARGMGIATVAVYSDADRDALHVGMADEAVRIGPPPVAESYLSIENIIAACKAAAADAVHPGYGFLSEQASFPRALAASGIAFIGPHPGAIEAMGDKIEAKKLAQNAGVATVPGFSGVIDDAHMAAKIAAEIGYPVILKASAGGGGRGMRIVESGEGIAEGFARAASEAKSAFGDSRVFMEKYITDPRHIEIQVLGDKHGNLIHLGERECSIQRRHQKIIEEAPSPFLDGETRDKMGEQAIALARAVKYDSAGTVEFIAAQDGNFYFLEMNTRLQVEHRVTELITGIDIVEQMIRSAAGQRLALTQTGVHFEGSAIESRILAEDPSRNFLPSAGRLKTYRPPGGEGRDGSALCIDSGVREGDEVSIHYDSLIAKLVTHAPHRTTAIEAQARALDRFVIEGVANNIAFLASMMGHERVRAGRLSTGFIAEEYPRGFTLRAPKGEISVLFACVAAAIDHVMNERKRKISGQVPLQQPLKFTRTRSVMLGKMRHDVTLDDGGESLAVCFEETKRACLCVSHWVPGQPVWIGTIDGDAIAVQVRPLLNGIHLTHDGFGADARVYTRREAEMAQLIPEKKPPAGSNVLRCSMPGLVKAIPVIAGQAVRTGDTLCIIEAMKMETAVCAEFDAMVAKIHVQPGDILALDAIIMTFE